MLARGNATAIGDDFAIREDTEILGKRDHTNTGVFSIREDTQVLEDSVFSRRGAAGTAAGADDGAFAIREDTEVLRGVVGSTKTGVFSVREDTEVLGGEFAVREDTEVLNNLVVGEKAGAPARSMGPKEQQAGGSGVLLGGERYESMHVLGPSVQQGSTDLALRAPSGHLRPINKSGSLQLPEADGGVGAAEPVRRSIQKVRESSARRRLQFGGEAASAAEAPGSMGLLAPKGVASCDLERIAAQALLAGGSSELPEDEDFTVLESEAVQQVLSHLPLTFGLTISSADLFVLCDCSCSVSFQHESVSGVSDRRQGVQEGASGGPENALLDANNSQGRDSFLDDSDTENAGAVAGSGAARLQAALAATSSRGVGESLHLPLLHNDLMHSCVDADAVHPGNVLNISGVQVVRQQSMPEEAPGASRTCCARWTIAQSICCSIARWRAKRGARARCQRHLFGAPGLRC